MNKRSLSAYSLLAASILLSAMAQLLLKAAMTYHGIDDGFGFLFTTNAGYWLLAGLCCYALSMISWLVLLARWPLSLAYPMLSLSYILVYLGAGVWPLLHESFTTTRSLGLLIVVVGVILVNRKSQTNGIG